MIKDYLIDVLTKYPDIIPIMFFGFGTLLIKIFTTIINNRKKFSVVYYVTEFFYTCIAISIGVFLCWSFEFDKPAMYIGTIVSGLVGSTAIRLLFTNQETIIRNIAQEYWKKFKKTINETEKPEQENNSQQ